MIRSSGGKCFGIKLLSTVPPDYYESGGYWQLTFLFWQLAGDVILTTASYLDRERREKGWMN
jgi:hypothetical protein